MGIAVPYTAVETVVFAVIGKLYQPSYKNLIDALDEMQICNIGKYVITDIADADQFLIKNYESKGELSQNIAE